MNQKNAVPGSRPPVHPVSLRFTTPVLREDFKRYFLERSLTYVRLALFLAILIYLWFALLDRYVAPEIVSQIMTIRLSTCVVFLIAIGLTFSRWGQNHLQLLMGLVVVIGALGVVAMVLLFEQQGSQFYYAGLILAIMYAHTLLRLRFVYATLSTWFFLGVYVVATTTLGYLPSEIVLNNVFFLAAANLIGMFASYSLEYYMRAEFWQSRRLAEQSADLEAEHDRKSRELDRARHIQLSMLPQERPVHPHYDFSFYMDTAVEIGGDYFDLHVADDDTLTFAIGDATGHGTQAGAMVTAMKVLFTEHGRSMEPAVFLTKASASLRSMGFRKLYMAFALGRLKDHRLDVVGAGLPHGLLFRAESGEVEAIPLKGLPLGSPFPYPYRTIRTVMHPGDTLLLMTDGYAERFNSDGEMLGYEDARKLLGKAGRKTPDELIQMLDVHARGWANHRALDDDVTFLVIQRKVAVASADHPAFASVVGSSPVDSLVLAAGSSLPTAE